MADSVGDLIKIGKPSAFHNDIDKDHRVGKFLRSRMNIIDLLPCTYKMNFAAAMESQSDSAGLVPQVDYDVMDEYKLTCTKYGLKGVSGLRLFTTDSTISTDSISNSLKDNYFQTGINALSKVFSPIQDMMRSVDQNLTADLMSALNKSKPIQDMQTSNDSYNNVASKILSTVTDVMGKGYRISLPAIWNDSMYTPNFQAQIKLASPSGHPKAIKEFIIRPLMHLLILASPKTEDGVSYGNPYCLTIKAYGMNYTPIGMISNMTLRRGGNDSSYNMFRQPLSIDVSLDFQYLVKGFAHYTDKSLSGENEINCFSSSDGYEYLDTSPVNTALPTVGHIVKSLRPREPDIDYTTKHTNMDAARNTKETGSESSFYSSLVGSIPTPSSSPIASIPISNSQISSDKSILSDIGSQIANAIISEAIDSVFS